MGEASEIVLRVARYMFGLDRYRSLSSTITMFRCVRTSIRPYSPIRDWRRRTRGASLHTKHAAGAYGEVRLGLGDRGVCRAVGKELYEGDRGDILAGTVLMKGRGCGEMVKDGKDWRGR